MFRSLPGKSNYFQRLVDAVSYLEDALLIDIKRLKLPIPEREWRFHPTRRWRFDLAWPGDKVAAEVEGATWANGRHNRGSGFEADCIKYGEAAISGWRVVRVTKKMIEDGRAVDLIERALKAAEQDRLLRSPLLRAA